MLGRCRARWDEEKLGWEWSVCVVVTNLFAEAKRRDGIVLG